MVTRRPARSAPSRGYVLAATLLLSFVVALLLLALTRWWEGELRREKERELLWVGSQFRDALDAYMLATPTEQVPRPVRLEELLLDERGERPRRHLRRLYRDPLTGTTDWGVIRAADGTIVGVHSKSTARPLPADGSSPRFHAFEDSQRYDQWHFTGASAPR